MLALLLLLQTPAPAPVPATDPVAQEVTVIGRKLGTWRASMTSGRGGLSCRTKKSSGDPEVDAIGCASMLHCWPAALPRLEASTAKGVTRADRRRLQAEAGSALAACGEAQRRERIDALALRRTGG